MHPKHLNEHTQECEIQTGGAETNARPSDQARPLPRGRFVLGACPRKPLSRRDQARLVRWIMQVWAQELVTAKWALIHSSRGAWSRVCDGFRPLIMFFSGGASSREHDEYNSLKKPCFFDVRPKGEKRYLARPALGISRFSRCLLSVSPWHRQQTPRLDTEKEWSEIRNDAAMTFGYFPRLLLSATTCSRG